MPASQSPGLAIQVQGLEKSYKELQVLRGVDFDVERGSIFALLGSNGAGKTTVVKILSTLLKADAGTASVNGSDVTTQPAKVRESIGGCGRRRGRAGRGRTHRYRSRRDVPRPPDGVGPMSAGEALVTTFAVTGPIDVAVDLGVGDLRVIAADRADAVVEVRPADPAKTGDVAAAARTQVDLADSVLTVRTPGRWRLYTPPGNRPEAVHVTLNVPTGSRLRASAVFSALHVEGRLAACRFRTSMGNVWLEKRGRSTCAPAPGA
jgi:energy-coupling factor transporter ATP-binding protein EcfA2